MYIISNFYNSADFQQLGFKQTELIDAGIQPAAPDIHRSLKAHNDADQLVSERVQTGSTNWSDVAYFVSVPPSTTIQQDHRCRSV